jgi:hypothetical protein
VFDPASMGLHHVVDDVARLHQDCPLPRWSTPSSSPSSEVERIWRMFHACNLSFAPGLLGVMTSQAPPPVEFFASLHEVEWPGKKKARHRIFPPVTHTTPPVPGPSRQRPSR